MTSIKKLDAKWKADLDEFWKGLGRLWKELLKCLKLIMNTVDKFLSWNFCYQPKNKKDKDSHIRQAIAVDTFIILTFWAWLRMVIVH